jgi:hypothetical protein
MSGNPHHTGVSRVVAPRFCKGLSSLIKYAPGVHAMGNLSLAWGEQIADIGCGYGDGGHRSAYGFICKDGDAYSLYYATLHTDHQEPSVGLTLSVGKWWNDDAVEERQWVFLRVWATGDEFKMEVLEPSLSQHYDNKSLGKALTRDAALASPLLTQIFEVADYIVLNDPAVNSYLETGVERA